LKKFRFLAAAAITLALFWALGRPWPVSGARIPPAGRFLSPFSGFWVNGTGPDKLPDGRTIKGLKQEVRVLWDDRRVPHVFAENDHDAYFMQGWLTARDRLWQMEFQTHVAAGRLSEIVGEQALDLDRYHRRLGLPPAAERILEAISGDRLSLEAATAFSDGVNAWIEGLSDEEIPLEYKILDYEPERWSPLKTALLMKSVSLTLGGLNDELATTVTREILGRKETDRLFPAHRPFTEPLVPEEIAWEFPKPVLNEPTSGLPELSGWEFSPQATGGNRDNEEHAAGSNSWAVAGSRTAHGGPILASDPHLGLTLPSIWYEIQITTPEYSVYGVSFPGAPGVMIGFNRHIAWGVTAGLSDAMDQYLVKFENADHDRYFHDGTWKPVNWREETYRIRDRKAVREKTAWTHHGPVPYLPGEEPFASNLAAGAAIRWTAHDQSNEIRTFLELNRATGYDSFRNAVSHLDNPVVNFLFASRDGDIAAHHEGKLPIRREGQGVYLSDGTDPANDWPGWIPRSRMPHVLNPARGYLGSANQNPVSPDYPYFLGNGFDAWERATRAFSLLEVMESITPEMLLAMQNDNIGLYARKLLPELLSVVVGNEWNDREQQAIEILENWNHSYDASAIGPTLFDHWQRELANRIWNDDITADGRSGRRPGRDVTLQRILEDPDSSCFDDRSTEEVETFGELALASFRTIVASLSDRYGEPGESWRWSAVRPSRLNHLGRIPGLGRYNLPTSGQYGVIRANTSNFGQSWRMVVAPGQEPEAYGIFPGGQSGNPGSAHYDDFVDDWVEGEAYRLLFLESPDAEPDQIAGRAVFRGR
jgi:penicillin amidase